MAHHVDTATPSTKLVNVPRPSSAFEYGLPTFTRDGYGAEGFGMKRREEGLQGQYKPLNVQYPVLGGKLRPMCQRTSAERGGNDLELPGLGELTKHISVSARLRSERI